MTSAFLFQIQSALIFSLMFFGITKRHNRKIHVPTMIAVMAWDILLVLQIELGRGAVLKASQALSNPMMLNIHVALAVSCVVLYGVLIYSGRKLLHNDLKIKIFHRRIGWTTFILRLLTLATSFFAVKPQ